MCDIIKIVFDIIKTVCNIIKGRLQKEKNVKFGLLAEIRRGRGLRGVQEPNLLSGIFLIV